MGIQSGEVVSAPITQWDIAESLEALGFNYDRTEQLFAQLNPRFIRAGSDVWLHSNNAALEVTVGVGADTGWNPWIWRVIESGRKLAEGLGRIALDAFFDRYDELID